MQLHGARRESHFAAADGLAWRRALSTSSGGGGVGGGGDNASSGSSSGDEADAGGASGQRQALGAIGGGPRDRNMAMVFTCK